MFCLWSSAESDEVSWTSNYSVLRGRAGKTDALTVISSSKVVKIEETNRRSPTFDPNSRRLALFSRITSWRCVRNLTMEWVSCGRGRREWRMRTCDHQDAVCGNLSAAPPPLRLTQFYIYFVADKLSARYVRPTDCLWCFWTPLAFKEVAKNIRNDAEIRENLVRSEKTHPEFNYGQFSGGERGPANVMEITATSPHLTT